ncbi:hypothetical protein [Bythopirellula goksoeyrii]|uniref:Uncharacterized protein n=1 Tax=Bythopirellula goksoeyrii TaxID=1400387 RepID=A0A5B9QPP6_9BACT|nr:hypothetical protein [Bythopirellula goksoeyrii]QEG35943.1 hypothetical protein Pr1d_32510 [Bythopirellula goksoeyrii]
MNSVADALVYAVAYINCQEIEDEESLDDSEDANEAAMSHIMAYLLHATPEEEEALAAAAKRALIEEQSLSYPQQEMIDFFKSWMEYVLGGDWDGNERAWDDA